jgi:MFS family permease
MPSKSFSVQRNLIALYLIKIAKWMNLVMPVVVLFYTANGLTMQDIFILQGIYSVTLMVLEIPTGIFADRAGRRTSIITGSLLGFSGYAVYSFSDTFWWFVLAEVLLGISQSLVSGADSAMLFDTLQTGHIQDKYSRFEGRITSIGNFGEAFAGIIGGFLAVGSLRYPYYAQTGVALLAIPAAFALIEPPIRSLNSKPEFRQIRQVIINVLVKDKKLKWNTLFSAFTGAATLTMAWFAQPYFQSIHIPVKAYGLLWSILNLSVGITAIYAWKIEKKLGVINTVLLFTISLILPYIFLNMMPAGSGLILLLIFYLARGLATPLLRNYINLITSSEVRATVLSVRNFIIRLTFAVLGPLFGWITDNYNLTTAIISAGCIYGFSITISLYFFIKYKTYTA